MVFTLIMHYLSSVPSLSSDFMNLASLEFAESPSACDLGPRRAVLSTEEPFRISKILSSVSFFCTKSSGVSLGRLKLGSFHKNSQMNKVQLTFSRLLSNEAPTSD